MLPLIRFVVSTKSSFEETIRIFENTLESYPFLTGVDKVHLSKLLQTWFFLMLERQVTIEKPLEKGEWAEHYVNYKYSGYDINAMIVITS